jgi:uncharacterized surface protein with fasciclin (FAS1) repeats
MNFKRRGVRLAAALTLTGLIASQIPMNSGIALARDAYGGRGNTSGSVAIQVAVAGLVGYGIFATATSGVGGGAVATGAGGGGAVIPPIADISKSPIWDVTAGSQDMKQFAAAADKAGLKADLQKAGQFTAFVPTDSVFASASALPGGYVPSNTVSGKTPTKTLTGSDKIALANFLKGHIILGRYTYDQLKDLAAPLGTDGSVYPTLNGGTIKVTFIDNVLRVNDAVVEPTDLQANNGIIHRVNAAILTTPPAPTAP